MTGVYDFVSTFFVYNSANFIEKSRTRKCVKNDSKIGIYDL